MKKTLHCLHGFLGAPSDWDMFRGQIGPETVLVTPDLFGKDSFPDTETLDAWGSAYARREAQHRQTRLSQGGANYLLGYSLGGRLALHVALNDPSLWDGLIIIGANPGLESEQARQQRQRNDNTWALRFETEPWETVLAAWDAQPVFGGRQAPFVRQASSGSRTALSLALRRWSLGAQSPLWDALPALICPVLWIAGAEDTGQRLILPRIQALLPLAEVWLAPDAAHRVPWEQPEMFAHHVRAFIGG